MTINFNKFVCKNCKGTDLRIGLRLHVVFKPEPRGSLVPVDNNLNGVLNPENFDWDSLSIECSECGETVTEAEIGAIRSADFYYEG